MKILERINLFSENNPKNSKIKKIIDKLPDNITITKEMLTMLGNSTTNVIIDNDFKNSYYVFMNDKIYLSNKENNKYTRVCLIAHECVHSIQNKILQWFNFILSNLELLAFFLCAVLIFFDKSKNISFLVYTCIWAISVLVRSILEIHAVYKSIYLSKKYLDIKISKNDAKDITNVYSYQAKVLFPLFFISLFYAKMIRLVILTTIFKIF
ncbi:MAG: hypothetical protein N2749_06185 [Clostridia bacterium]|nr:hypothetical protein [Clostridia bacterium]